MSLPKIAIIGYGQMGKEIERIARERGFVITDVFDIDKPIDLNREYAFEVGIDFTQPDAVLSNAVKVSSMGKNLVIGSTGWYDDMDKLSGIIKTAGTGCVWGSNFSIGMNMFFKIIELAAKLANKTEDYDVFMHEIHHVRKKDSPSGTAISLANIALKYIERKKEVLDNTSRDKIKPEALHLSSTRGGETTGTHTVYLDSAADTIELTHRAKNRSGLASGALTAAEWIHGKTGFYEFSEALNEKWNI